MRNVISTSIKRPTLSMFLNITLSNELKINEVMTEFSLLLVAFTQKGQWKNGTGTQISIVFLILLLGMNFALFNNMSSSLTSVFFQLILKKFTASTIVFSSAFKKIIRQNIETCIIIILQQHIHALMYLYELLKAIAKYERLNLVEMWFFFLLLIAIGRLVEFLKNQHAYFVCDYIT